MSIRDLVLIVALAEWCLHYFPWKKLIGIELPRLAAYTLGMLGIMVPFTIYLSDRGEMELLQTLWIAIAAAGLVVFGLYGFDHYIELYKRDIESAQKEKLMLSLIKGKDEQS